MREAGRVTRRHGGVRVALTATEVLSAAEVSVAPLLAVTVAVTVAVVVTVVAQGAEGSGGLAAPTVALTVAVGAWRSVLVIVPRMARKEGGKGADGRGAGEMRGVKLRPSAAKFAADGSIGSSCTGLFAALSIASVSLLHFWVEGSGVGAEEATGCVGWGWEWHHCL